MFRKIMIAGTLLLSVSFWPPHGGAANSPPASADCRSRAAQALGVSYRIAGRNLRLFIDTLYQQFQVLGITRDSFRSCFPEGEVVLKKIEQCAQNNDQSCTYSQQEAGQANKVQPPTVGPDNMKGPPRDLATDPCDATTPISGPRSCYYNLDQTYFHPLPGHPAMGRCDFFAAGKAPLGCVQAPWHTPFVDLDPPSIITARAQFCREHMHDPPDTQAAIACWGPKH